MSLELPYRGVELAARGAFALAGYRFTFTGRENVPRTGGAVMAINHTAYPDFLMAGLGARKQHRWVRFMAKKSIWSHKYAGPVMRALKHIPVDRRSGGEAYRLAVAALKDGEIVGVYPEATMSRSFEIKELKPGAVRMAQEAGVPILPTIVWGAHRIWTKDIPKNFSRSHIPIHVAIGAPIEVGPDDDVTAVTQHLRETMQRMLDEVIAAYPPLTGEDLRYLPARLGGTAPTYDDAYHQDLSDMQRTRDEFTG
ncbi:lysophospholipid acyltransferase family protein [Kribbia dieselivorans]|uniref:lysophospholipid acyltransferase family protein n=1 Tax=Kribbia dieselivorans TaxID=331526 RepID=UPI000837AEEB|nr:lysophospholipid acyltransferase family protein [Kribbia dieselivorans]